MQQDLRVGLGAKPMSLSFKRRTQLPVVVDFPVKGDDELAVDAYHRLRAPFGEINDGQPAMPEAHTLILRIPLAKAIWSARGHVITNAPTLDTIHRICSVVIGVDARYTAHERVLGRFRYRSSVAQGWPRTETEDPLEPSEGPPSIAGSPIAELARGSPGLAAVADLRLRSSAGVHMRARRRPRWRACSRSHRPEPGRPRNLPRGRPPREGWRTWPRSRQVPKARFPTVARICLTRHKDRATPID